jgi:hypothetical protein
MVFLAPPVELLPAPLRAQIVRGHQEREQRRTDNSVVQEGGQLLGTIDVLVGPIALVEEDRNFLELGGAGQLCPEVLGKLLRPELQVGVVPAGERAVAVADEQVVLKWLTEKRHGPSWTRVMSRLRYLGGW